MKPYADKGRTEREFQVGDQVFLNLQPYRKLSVALRRNFKFNPRFYGPVLVIQKVGLVACKLKFPEGSLIHLVFHVSISKKVGSDVVVTPALPRIDEIAESRCFQ